MRKVKILLLGFVIASSLTGCALYHHYGLYYGKVVDAETKEPLEGAAVLAVYYTQQYGLAGANDNYLDAQETVTDKNGEFKIPSLNSFAFRPLQSFEPYVWFTIFKPVYGCYPKYKGVKPMFLPNGSLPTNQYVVIEQPSVRNASKEERLRNAACLPSPSVPEKKYLRLQDLLQVEYQSIGY